jgi:peptidoglycan/LPS O-acetylase OafA/YrhL
MPGPPNVFFQKGNIWNSLRLVLAVLVIYGHSFAISPDGKSQDVFIKITRGITWSGDLAVVVFFFISGAFITQSALRTSSPFQFLKKRVYRIYPALFFCLIVNTFVLIPIFNQNGASFTELFQYFIQNSSTITNQHFVQNVWALHPDKSLNGVLWSITLEVRLYLVFFLLLLCLTKISRETILHFQLFLLISIVLFPEKVALLGSDPSSLGNPDFPLHVFIFLSGGIFSLLNLNFRTVSGLFLFGSLIWIFTPSPTNSKNYLYLSVITLLLLVSTWKRLKWLNLKNDYSYGLYLWGWPMQQCVKSLQFEGYIPEGPTYNFLYSFFMAMFFAYLSWHFLEKRFLKRAKSSKIEV